MKTQIREGVVVLVLAGVLAGSLPVLGAGGECITKQWLEQHRGTLPQSYEQFLAAPPALRHAIFDSLEPQTQSKLWVAHLQRFLSRNPGLSADQLAVVQQAIELAARPETFATARDSELWEVLVGEPLAELESRVRAVFNPRQTAAILSELGGREVMEAPVVAGSKVAAVFCQCSTSSDWCTGGAHCVLNGGGCTHQQGCGTFWQYICNGLCGENVNVGLELK
jgi:hypothetical protein